MALDFELDYESMQYFDVKDQWNQIQREFGVLGVKGILVGL
jgi:hypothetical protein